VLARGEAARASLPSVVRLSGRFTPENPSADRPIPL
jgi:hypothetical protein